MNAMVANVQEMVFALWLNVKGIDDRLPVAQPV
jgi:hypothetical protein